MPKKTKKSDGEDVVRRLLRVEDNLAGTRFAIDAYDNLRLKNDIEVEMDDVLHGFQMTGVLEAHAEERYENSRIELDEFWGQLEEHAREMEVMSRPTDQKVKAYIQRDAEYISRKKRLSEIKRRWHVLKHLNKAFYMKYELIRTKSANVRKETGDLGTAPDNPKRYPREKKRRK